MLRGLDPHLKYAVLCDCWFCLLSLLLLSTRSNLQLQIGVVYGQPTTSSVDAGRLSSPTTRSNRRHNPAMDVSAVDPSDPNEAVSKRTRSKHPLGPGQFDPTEFDRLLAEFDPDAELVMDDQMYASFLQVGLNACHT